MKTLALTLAAVALTLFVGCKADPQPSPKAGLNLGNQFETAGMLAEIELVGWAKASADTPTTQDAGAAETAIGTIGPGPVNIPIATVTFQPTGTLTASDTQNAIISVYKRNAPDGGGGTTQTLLASASTFTPGLDGGTGSWSPFTLVNFTVVSGAFVSPGDVITVAIVKNGLTGVSVPSGNLSLFTKLQ